MLWEFPYLAAIEKVGESLDSGSGGDGLKVAAREPLPKLYLSIGCSFNLAAVW